VIFGWAVCTDCYSCLMYKSKTADGSVKLYGTTNMTDHAKHCSPAGQQKMITSFIKRKPGVKFSDADRSAVKEAKVRLVVEAGVSFAIVNNPGLRHFAQQMILIGAKHGNVAVDDVVYGPHTVRNAVFRKMSECQELIKTNVATSA